MEIKDVLHLYLGCEVRHRGTGNIKYVLSAVFNDGTCKIYDALAPAHTSIVSSESLKPILRPLSDITEEENQEVSNLWFEEAEKRGKVDVHVYAVVTNWYRRKGFDIDGLIESGQAINKTTL